MLDMTRLRLNYIDRSEGTSGNYLIYAKAFGTTTPITKWSDTDYDLFRVSLGVRESDTIGYIKGKYIKHKSNKGYYFYLDYMEFFPAHRHQGYFLPVLACLNEAMSGCKRFKDITCTSIKGTYNEKSRLLLENAGATFKGNTFTISKAVLREHVAKLRKIQPLKYCWYDRVALMIEQNKN